MLANLLGLSDAWHGIMTWWSILLGYGVVGLVIAGLIARRATVKRLALTLSVLCMTSLLTNCVTTRGTATAGRAKASHDARCAGWRAIDYSAKGDTTRTVTQVRRHNQTGVNKRCWK
jgi:uncharacterized membrane protein YeiB